MARIEIAGEAVSVGAILTLLLNNWELVVTAIGVGAAVWQRIRARNYRGAYELSDQTLGVLIAGVDIWRKTHPGPQADKLKATLKAIAEFHGVERDKLAPMVEQIKGFLAQEGAISGGGSSAQEDAEIAASAGRAVEAARAALPKAWAKRKPPDPKPPAGASPVVGIVLALALGAGVLTSCCTSLPVPERVRMTDETYVEGQPAALVIRWPAGAPTDPEAYWTGEVDGRMSTVVPFAVLPGEKQK